MNKLIEIYNNIVKFFHNCLKVVTSILSIFGIDSSFIKFGLIVLLVKAFIVEGAMVPSCSMTPTARTGDIVLVNKMSYGISSQQIFLPPFLGLPGCIMLSKRKINPFYILHKIFPNISIFDIAPKRGDLCSFVISNNPKILYFKRIVALEGDIVQVIDGVLYINNNPVLMEDLGEAEFVTDRDTNKTMKGKRYKITMDSGASYEIFRHCKIGLSSHDNTPIYVVPKGCVWVQGDFNTGSADSFAIDYTGGGIPVENLLGKPVLTVIGSNSRDEKENVSNIEYLATMPIRILKYIYYIDFLRFLKRLK